MRQPSSLIQHISFYIKNITINPSGLPQFPYRCSVSLTKLDRYVQKISIFKINHNYKLQLLMESIQTCTRQIKDSTLVLRLSGQRLTVEIKNIASPFFFSNVIQNKKLPSHFINIFETVQQVYDYLKNGKNLNISLNATEQLLLFGVPSPNQKIKMLQIDLTSVPIQKDQLIERELASQKDEIKKLSEKVEKLQKILCEQIAKEKVLIYEVQNLKKDKGNSSKKDTKNTHLSMPASSNRCMQVTEKNRTHPNYIIDQSTLPCEPLRQKPFIISPISSLNSLMKGRSSSNQENNSSQNISVNNQSFNARNQKLSKQGKQLNRKIQDFDFDIDEGNKYLNYFTINEGRIIKKYDNEDEIYQIYSSNPIPETGIYCVRFKIETITEGTIWFGLITEDKKIEQYIGCEPQNISLGCQAGKQLSISGKTTKIQFEQMKNGQMLEMQVDLSAKRVKFFKNTSILPLADVALPKDMFGKKVYPFFQLMAQDDSIMLM